MPAYVIVDIEVTDPVIYAEYKQLAPATVAAYGGRYLARGGQTEVLEGDWQPRRLVILSFESVERAKAWLDSPEYSPVKAFRRLAARSRMVVVAGVPVEDPEGAAGSAARPRFLAIRPNLPVRDLSRSVVFYRDTLGFDLELLSPEFQLAILSKGGAEVALFIQADPVPQGAYLYVQGIETLYARCRAHCVEITRELVDHPWGIREFVVQDPDGHTLGIGEKLAR